jgi:hypothetical protein
MPALPEALPATTPACRASTTTANAGHFHGRFCRLQDRTHTGSGGRRIRVPARRDQGNAEDRHADRDNSSFLGTKRGGMKSAVLPPLAATDIHMRPLQPAARTTARSERVHPHPGRRQRPEELHHLAAPQLLAQHRALGRINPVQLKNTLGRVHFNAHNLAHGRLPRLRSSNDLILAQRCRRGPSTPTGRNANVWVPDIR